MPSIMNLAMPESMIKSIENMAKTKNCSSNTIVKLAVAKFLFNQTLLTPEIHKDKTNADKVARKPMDLSKEIPMEKIISVQYTLDDGRIIHILRERKMR